MLLKVFFFVSLCSYMGNTNGIILYDAKFKYIAVCGPSWVLRIKSTKERDRNIVLWLADKNLPAYVI